MNTDEIQPTPAPLSPPRAAKPKRQPESPQAIRDLLCQDPASVSDCQLLALVLATGARGPNIGSAKRSWTSLELADKLLDEAGGRLGDLVQATCADAIDWRNYGIGKSIGARLIAAMELAERWRAGAAAAVGQVAAMSAASLSRAVFERRRTPAATELLALIVGAPMPDIETGSRLVTACGSFRELVGTLSLNVFEPVYRRSRVYMRFSGTDFEIELAALCRLVAAVELARRYRGLKSPTPASLGLASKHLAKLLDPATPLDRDLRQGLIEQLRSHPELTADFARLDRLTAEAGIEDFQRAAEVHQMLHTLLELQGWSHPAEIVSEPVPYRALLNIAQAMIKRTEPPPRILEVKQLLETAEREAVASPVSAFVESLRDLNLSESGADRAFEDARRGYGTAELQGV